jgi:pilus assembly protein CpaE
MQSDTFLVAVISANREMHENLAAALEDDRQVESFWTLADYPAPQQIAELLECRSGCVVFLDFADGSRAEQVARQLGEHAGKATVIGIQPAGSDAGRLIEMMRLGIEDALTAPLLARDAQRAFQRAKRRLSPEAQPARAAETNLYAFLPAKPGVGATTVAAHAAAAAARLAGRRTLLIDFDLRLGMTSFLFKLHGEHSVLDALGLGSRLEDLWEQMIGRVGMLDVLGSAPVQFGREYPEAGAAMLLDFATARYQTVCVDLPGEMRDHELQALARAKEIFLVCMPEVGSLHLAKGKADLLRQLGVAPKVSVVMNRTQGRGAVSIGDVEAILQLPVRFTLPPAEKEIAAATQRAVAIEGRSAIAAQLENLGRRMIPQQKPPGGEETRSRSFLEFFSVTPVRDRTAGRR